MILETKCESFDDSGSSKCQLFLNTFLFDGLVNNSHEVHYSTLFHESVHNKPKIY